MSIAKAYKRFLNKLANEFEENRQKYAVTHDDKKCDELRGAYIALLQKVGSFENVIQDNEDRIRYSLIFQEIHANCFYNQPYDTDYKNKRNAMLVSLNDFDEMKENTRIVLKYVSKCFNPIYKIPKKLYANINVGQHLDNTLVGKMFEMKSMNIIVHTYDFWKSANDLQLLMKYNNVVGKAPYHCEYFPNVRDYGSNLYVADRMINQANKDDLTMLMEILDNIYTKYK